MILQFGPEAPWILHFLAAAALVLHIGGGTMGMISGGVAMFARKGGRLHRVAGTVFFVSMLFMTGIAAIVAPMLPEARWTNTTAAVFTLYLVLTAWATVRRRAGEVGRFERAVVAVPLGILELYLLAQAKGGPSARVVMAGGLTLATLLMGVGIAGSWFGLFAPVLAKL